MSTIVDCNILEAQFGGWPHFHDAEVDAVRLGSGRRVGGPPTLELDIYVLAQSVINADGARDSGPVVATLRFDDISAVQLSDFNHQNVLFDLVIQDVPPSEVDPRSISVELQSS
jgi:Immunity protein 50